MFFRYSSILLDSKGFGTGFRSGVDAGAISPSELLINHTNLDYNISVSTENDISNIIKWLLGYGTKVFNYQTFKK